MARISKQAIARAYAVGKSTIFLWGPPALILFLGLLLGDFVAGLVVFGVLVFFVWGFRRGLKQPRNTKGKNGK